MVFIKVSSEIVPTRDNNRSPYTSRANRTMAPKKHRRRIREKEPVLSGADEVGRFAVVV